MGNYIPDYVNSEEGILFMILIYKTLTLTEQTNALYRKANQRLVLMKRHCHLANVLLNKRRDYYILTMMRSILK